MNKEDSRNEREARSLALEKAYVHDVYNQISTHFSMTRSKAWPKVTEFLRQLEPGSLVADIGCGNGKYLRMTNDIFSIGLDRCDNFLASAHKKGHEVLKSDNLSLPFREEAFDACISVAVIHHLATTERRVSAIRELAKILKIGGKLMITAWAKEQRNRKFESQDVLVPWQRPKISSSLYGGKYCSIDRDPNSTTTDDEELFHNYRQGQIKERQSTVKRHSRKSFRRRTFTKPFKTVKGINVDGKSEFSTRNQSSDFQNESFGFEEGTRTSFPCRKHWNVESEVTSPKDSCYSFVRKALQRLTNVRRLSGKRSYSISEGYYESQDRNKLDKMKIQYDSMENVPIELRHLEPEDPKLLQIPSTYPGLTLNVTASLSLKNEEDEVPTSKSPKEQQVPSPSLSDESRQLVSSLDIETSDDFNQSKSSSSCFSLSSRTNISSSLSTSNQSCLSNNSTKGVTDYDSHSWDSGVDEETARTKRKRPVLQKQKASIQQTDGDFPITITISEAEKEIHKNVMSIDVNNIEHTEKDYLNITKIGAIKQSSLNDELIYIDRVLENEEIKKNIKKQSSLNDDFIYSDGVGSTEKSNEGFLHSQKISFRSLRENFNKLRTFSLDHFEFDSTEPIKSFAIKLVQNWKSETIKVISSNLGGSDVYERNMSWNKGEKYTSEQQLDDTSLSQMPENDELWISEKNDINNSRRTSRESRGSREESSDSSKENSIQSDTSIDSEESFVSVIYVPKQDTASNSLDKTRNRSVSSESSEGSDKPNSPKSPKSPKSPGGAKYFSGSKLLAAKVARFCNSNFPIYSQSDSIKVNPCPPKEYNCERVSSSSNPDPLSSESTIFTLVSTTSNSLPSNECETIFTSTVPADSSSNILISSALKPKDNLDCKGILKQSCSSHVKGSNIEDSSNPGNAMDFKSSEVENIQTLPMAERSKNCTFTTSAVTTSERKPKNEANKNWQPKLEENSSKSLQKNRINPVDNKNFSKLCDAMKHNSLKKNDGLGKAGPRLLTFEVFNPETDDLDSDSSSSSSPHSANSIIERGWPTEKEIDELDREIKRKEEEEKLKLSPSSVFQSHDDKKDDLPKMFLVEPVHRMDTINEETLSTENSRENSPKDKDFPKGASRRTSTPTIQMETSSSYHLGFHSGDGDLKSVASNDIKKRLLQKSNNSTMILPNTQSTVLEEPISSRVDEPIIQSHYRRKSPGDDMNVNSPSISEQTDFSNIFSIKNSNDSSGVVGMKHGFDDSQLSTYKVANHSRNIAENNKYNTGIEVDEKGIQQPISIDQKIYQLKHIQKATQSDSHINTNSYEKQIEEISPLLNTSKTALAISRNQYSSNMSDLLPKSSGIRKMSVSTLSKFKIECHQCKEEEARRKLAGPDSEYKNECTREEELLRSVAYKRSRLRLQSSLDSSQEREKESGSSTKSELSRSSSLDFESIQRWRSEFSIHETPSTSQDSLQSEGTGGAPTLHRYYHVFKEGELDQLIEKYVQNLHIISSFYDHANWCIVAEKVHVWTI